MTRPAAPRRAAFTSLRRFYPSLLSPYHRATVGRRVTFLWRPVRRASYYNIQIWDDRLRRRLVARWPRARTLTLRLPPGRYRWYVYPGFGAQRNARYGDLWGQGSFTVRR